MKVLIRGSQSLQVSRDTNLSLFVAVISGSAHMMFAPPPSLPETESGGGGPPPRSSSASSLNTAGLHQQQQQPPTFPPPPPPQQPESGISPPSQNNGPASAFQKSPNTATGGSASPSGGSTSLQFPPTLTSPFDPSSGGRAPTPRMQQQQISDGKEHKVAVKLF